MIDPLKDVGQHSGTYGNGHYEATAYDNGNKIGNFAIDFATSLWYHIVLEVTKNA